MGRWLERTAHNGFDIGSIPIKLNIYCKNIYLMKFQRNSYQKILLKYLFKNNYFLFICNGFTLKQLSWIHTEQNLNKNQLILYKIKKIILNSFLSDTIFQNVQILGTGYLLLLHYKSFAVTSLLHNLKLENLLFISIIFQNNLYLTAQLNKLTSFKFLKITQELIKKNININKNRYIPC